MVEVNSKRKGAIPLYVQVASELERRLQAGYKPGDRFPALEQLAQEFQVAVVTVRQAMELLERDGLVQRARGIGTTVLKTPAPAGEFRISARLNDLMDATRDTRPVVIRSVPLMPPPELVPAHSVLAPAYQFMHRVHAIDGQPYAVLRVYLDARLYAALPPELFERETVVRALKTLDPSPIKSGRQRMSIGRAAADDAVWLKIPADSPVARIKRYFYDASGTLIYLAEVIYRGEFVSWEVDVDV